MTEPRINNDFYETLGERWITAKDDPVALLRAEGRYKEQWIVTRLEKIFPKKKLKILDIGCGAGFLAHRLSQEGHAVWGVDLSEGSLEVARAHDSTQRVVFQKADAMAIPHEAESFDVVCSMDFLEHVDQPMAVIAEASRLLRPGGLFFFHTFNRNWLSRIVVIKGVEWFVKNTPPHMHLYHLFIRPDELAAGCRKVGLEPVEWTGLAPVIWKKAFWKLLWRREVPHDFEFTSTSSLKLSYMGYAVKR